MSRRARFRRNALANVLGQALQFLVTFLLVPVLVRGLGPAHYGLYVLVWTIAAYLTVLQAGLGTSMVRDLAEFRAAGLREEEDLLIGTAWWSMLAVGALAAAALYALPGWAVDALRGGSGGDHGLARLVVAAAGAIFLCQSLSAVYSAVPQALQQFGGYNAIQAVVQNAPTVTAAAALWSGLGLRGVLGWTLAACLALLPAQHFLAVRALGRPWSWRWDAGMLGRQLSFGSKILASQVAWIVNFQLDRLIIGARFPMAELAYYQIPASLAQRLVVIPAFLGPLSLPLASELTATREAGTLKRVYLSSTKLIFGLLLPAALILSLFGYRFLALWVGYDVADQSTRILQLLLFGYFWSAVSTVTTGVAHGSGRPKVPMITAWLHAVLQVAGWIVLVPRLGVKGLAVSMAFATMVAVLVAMHLIHSRVLELGWGEFFARSVLRPLSLTLAVAAVAYPLRRFLNDWAGFLACGAAVGVVYAAGLWLFVLDGHERDMALGRP